MSNNIAPKIGLLDRVKIAFSDKAAVARVIAVTEALDAHVKSTDPNLCEQTKQHVWGAWGERERWERTIGAGKLAGEKTEFSKQRRNCTRCGFIEERELG